MAPTPSATNGLDFLVFLVALATWFVAWGFVVKRRKRFEPANFFAHLLGAATGFGFFFSLTVLWFAVTQMQWSHQLFALVLLSFSIGVFLLFTSPPKPATAKPSRVVNHSNPLPPRPTYQPSEADLQAIEQARKQSLQASKRAGEARKKDMKARGEKQSDPLWQEAYNRRSDNKSSNHSLSGEPFTEIEFDYLDANGNKSHRTVEVWAIDDEYLEGFCHKANDTRTFVIGRIRGKVLVHDTGEILSPRQWAASARKSPLNSGCFLDRL